MRGGNVSMKFGQDQINDIIEKIANETMNHSDCIVIGDNSCGKSLLLKKFIERKLKRRISEKVLEKFEVESKCSLENRKQCTVPCNALRKLQDQFSSLPEAQIILQPSGMKGKYTKEPLKLQYDVLNMEFQPANNFHTYSKSEKEFIESHIKRFKLNYSKYRTKQLFDFIRNVIDQEGSIPQYEYNNWIVEQFRKQIESKTAEEILKICKVIFTDAFLKM